MELTGIEPVTPCMPCKCSYQLSYSPTWLECLLEQRGGADGDRTRDPLHAMQVLVPAELQPRVVLKTVLIIRVHAMQVLVPAELQPRVVLKTVLIIRVNFRVSTKT